jgi:hypothetical protein
MVGAVVESNEVYLNGVYYPTTKPVHSVLASLYPAKVVIGDTSKDDQLRSSIVAWSDWRGGIGINRMDGAGDVNNAWYSTAQLRYKNHLVLPGLATESTAPTHGLADATIGAINTYGNEVYAFWNGSTSESPKLYKYNNTDDEWDAETQSATDQVTDSVVFTDAGGTTYLVFAHYDSNGSGYTYSSNGSSWTTDTTDTKFVTVWDERLWGISHTGQLWYATTIGTEVDDAVLPLPDGSVTDLFVARNAAGILNIYAATTEGLFMHNADNARFEETQMAFPIHSENGKGTTRWRDSVYIPSGLGVYKYINGSNSAVITVVGPDRDDGMPFDKRGAIRMMAGSHNELLAGIDARFSPLSIASTSVPYQWESHFGSPVIDPDAGYSSIVGYNEMGWETKWLSGTSGKGLDSMHVSSSYDEEYRVWWGHDNSVWFMNLPPAIINPSEMAEFEYALTATHETPWFNAGQSEVGKLALKLRIEAQNLTADETVKVEYATDYNETYTDAGDTIDASTMGAASGTYVYTFGSSLGTEFRSIKFKLTLNRSDATTTGLEKFESPDVVSLTMEWRKKIAAKWGHQVGVDLTNDYKGKTPKDLRSSLISAIESTSLVEFTFRDDGGGTRNYYVDVTSATGLEFTGYDERGNTTITVAEP